MEQGLTIQFKPFVNFNECAKEKAKYVIFLDENGAIFNSGDIRAIEKNGKTCFIYDTYGNIEINEDDYPNTYFLVEENIPTYNLENILRELSDPSVVYDAAPEDEAIIKEIFERLDAPHYAMDHNAIMEDEAYQEMEKIISNGIDFNTILLSSSRCLSDIMKANQNNDLTYTDWNWIILDVSDNDEETISQLISEGACVYAYKKVAQFNTLLDIINQMINGERPSEQTIYLYTYETF